MRSAPKTLAGSYLSRVLVWSMMCLALGGRILAADVSAAVAWYDTLDNPNVKDLPYVRVATGSAITAGNNPPEQQFVEGFLIEEDAKSFAVFLCSPPDFGRFEEIFSMANTHPSLTVARFVHKAEAEGYEKRDFQHAVSALLAKVREIQAGPTEFEDREKAFAAKYPALRSAFNFTGGRPLSYRAQIFGLARACQQKGLNAEAAELFDLVAGIPDEQTGAVNVGSLREKLQQQMGDAVLAQAEAKFGNPAIPLAEMLSIYENFATRYPAHSRVAYAHESEKLLRTMIAEGASHRPKPVGEMTPAEQVAEQIYQLRNLGRIMWSVYQPYPVATDKRDGKDGITPIHRLVDLGDVAVPQLIEALDDRRFTRSLVPRFKGWLPPVAMRVSDVAQGILEHVSGRRFHEERAKDGKLIGKSTRQQAEVWWQEVQGSGAQQALVKSVSAGGQGGVQSARILVEKYPNDALPAIEAALRVTAEPGYKGEYVEVAGRLPGDLPLAFLRSQLAPERDVFSQVQAARALPQRKEPEAVPAIIAAWRRIQIRLPRNEGDAFFQAGRLISFLATSGDARAIDALAEESKTAPVQVRYATVGVFRSGPYSGGSYGPQVALNEYVEKLPDGEAREAMERLVVAALDDTERCFGVEGLLGKTSFADPRVCDMAAFVLASRWPEKYAFQWSATAAENDPQIDKTRDRWRADHGLPSRPAPVAPAVIAPASDAEVAPLLSAFIVAQDEAGREGAAAKIVESLGLRALPAVRARLAQAKETENLKALAVALSSIVSEVHVTGDAGDMAGKSVAASLRGQALTGKFVHALGQRLETEMPAEISVVTLTAERAANSAGFRVTVGWLPGAVDLRAGWSRQIAVRAGDKTIHRDSHWASAQGVRRENVFREMANAFDTALQSDLDSPILLHLRLQRVPAQKR